MNSIKQNGSQKYGTYLKGLPTEEIEKLLSCVLQEMRRRDAEHVKGDVLHNSSKMMHRMRVED